MSDLIGLDPTSGPVDRTDEHVFSARPDTLDAAVVGIVANGLGRGEVMLDALYDRLARQFEVLGQVKAVKASVSIPPDPGDWTRLTSEATVAITGFGG